MSSEQAAESAASEGGNDNPQTVAAKPGGRSEGPEMKPNILKRLWAKAGLDVQTILLMIKGAMPPIIALAAYQSDQFAAQYTTDGYLVAIMALYSMAILPRAKFLQATLTSVIFVCTGAAIALLQIQCAVAARQSGSPNGASAHIGSSGSEKSEMYSSSASATSAVGLFFTIFVANLARAYRPQLIIPVIQYCIFTLVTSVYAPQYPDMAAGEDSIRRLLITSLTGFAFATGVSLFIFPMSSRTIFSKQVAGLFDLMKDVLGAHGTYMKSINRSYALRLQDVEEDDNANIKHDKQKKKKKQPLTEASAEAEALKGNLTAMAALFGKVRLEIGFAKKEIGFGKLGPEDYSAIFGYVQEILLPTMGVTTFMDIMQSLKEKKKRQDKLYDSEKIEAIRHLEAEEWEQVISMSSEPFQKLKTALIGGLTHATLVLELAPKPKTPEGDVEKTRSSSS